MNGPASAREALIVEALGEVAQLLDRVEALTASMEAGHSGLANASAELSGKLNLFEARMASVTQQVQTRAIEHIVRHTNEATRLSVEVQTRAMNDAARQAFTAHVDSTLARLTVSVRHLIQVANRPWEFWLTHVATAVASALITWFVVSLLAFR